MILSIPQEQLRRIRYRIESAICHSKNSDLIHTAETILDCSKDSVVEHSFAFEIQNRVYDVLESFWSRDSSVARNVTDDEHSDARFFCEAHEPCSALANLTDASRGSFEVGGENSLNGVDDND